MAYRICRSGDPSSNAEEYNWENDDNLQNLGAKGGTFLDVADAAETLTNMAGGDTKYHGGLGRLSESDLFQSIYAGNPVVILYLLTESEEPVDSLFSGHVVIVTGVYWNEEECAYYFTVFDPWAGASISEKKYEDILSVDEENGDHYKWRATVTAE